MPNKKVILIARTIKNETDYATKYIFHWAELIKDEAKLLGINVIDLQNEQFTEENMEKMINKFDPYIIFLNGHGTDYSLRGKDGETDVVIRCQNDHLFKGRVVYALSCCTANILGKSARNKGCKCYIGYTKKVIFPHQELDNPIKDYLSESFMMVSNEIVLTLMKGGTTEDAIINFNNLSDELIEHWDKSHNPSATIIKRYLKSFKNMIYAPIY